MSLLKSDRLYLRPMLPGDAPMIVRWRNSKHVASTSRESTKGNLSLKQHLEWFAKTREDQIDYIIELNKESLPIGSLSFAWRVLPGFKLCAELGKFIGEEKALGKGFASEATNLWLDHGFNALKLDCVIARTRKNNLSNIKVNQKMGFTVEPWPVQFGEASDEWIFMRLTRAQWMGHK